MLASENMAEIHCLKGEMLSLRKAVDGVQEAQKDLPEIHSRLQGLEEQQRTTSKWVWKVEQKTDAALPTSRWEAFLRDELLHVKCSIAIAGKSGHSPPEDHNQ